MKDEATGSICARLDRSIRRTRRLAECARECPLDVLGADLLILIEEQRELVPAKDVYCMHDQRWREAWNSGRLVALGQAQDELLQAMRERFSSLPKPVGRGACR